MICEVLDDSTGVCTDHGPTSEREEPPLDSAGSTDLNVTLVSVEGGWTSVTFKRNRGAKDDEDYDLGAVRFFFFFSLSIYLFIFCGCVCVCLWAVEEVAPS